MKLSKIKGITNATTVDLDFNGIMDLICSHGYSGSTFRNNHRCLENFEKTNLVILDVDEKLSLQGALDRLVGFKYILALTRNHQKDKYTKAGKLKPACDRFRIVLFLNGTITNEYDYKHTCRQLLDKFPELDTSCSEASRFFYASSEVYKYSSEGELIEIAVAPKQVVTRSEDTGKLGNLSAKTKDFLSNGAEDGTWNTRLFQAAIDLNEQNYPQDVALTLMNAIEEPLDESDLSTFESAYAREPKYKPRDNLLSIDGFEDDTKPLDDSPPPTSYEGLTIPFFEANLRQWLDDLFDANSMKLHINGDIKVNSRKIPFEYFLNLIYLSTGEARRYKFDSRGEVLVDKFKKKVSVPTAIAHRGIVVSYINKWMEEQRARILQETKEKIRFVEDNGEITKYVETITNVNQKLTEMVLRQFIYNVKLKIEKTHPEFILMPVFVGPQGVGKSLAVKKLLEPISHMSTPTDFAVFHDERKYKGLFGEKLVLEFDEMSAARKADIEAVKNKITAERVNYRPLGTTEAVTMFNMSSMIGSSNSTLIDLLYDDTGKRRFFELNCKIDTFWAEIKNIDALLLWQSVDVSGPPPIEPFLSELNNIQIGYKNLDSAEEFIIDEGFVVEEGDITFNIDSGEFYKQYADFMGVQKRQPFSRNKFYKRCRKLLKEVKGNSRTFSFEVKGE